MQKSIRFFALVSFIEGVAAFIWLASIPTSDGTFSPVRLASLLGILFVSLGCLIVFVRTKAEDWLVKKIEQIANNRVGIPVSFLLTGISFTIWVAVLCKEQLLLIMDEAIYTRLLPMAMFGVLFSLQLGMVFLIRNVGKATWADIMGPVWKPALILSGCFWVMWTFMSVTHIGFVFDDVGLSWGPPGTPVTFVQVNLVFLAGLLLAFAYSVFRSKIRPQWLPVRDVVIFIALWGFAVILWWNEPLSDTHFNPPLMAPNYEYYPNSDALIFDRSSYHLLFGTGFSNQLIRRPLYAGMLALFHKMGGFSYDDVIFLQILVLAFIPPLAYLLASKLENRLAGLIAGGLILLREKNSIELSDKIVTSNAKLMMSDMIAMLGVIAFLYVTIKVLSAKDRNIWLLGTAGACLGLTALVRAQVLILLPLLLLFILLGKRPLRIGVKESTLVMLGLVLAMSPWVWRNWKLTGTFVLDDRGEEKLLARNYSQNPVGFPPLLPGETEKEYSARIKRQVFAYVFEHPSDVAFFVSNHFLRNLAVSVVYTSPLYSVDSPYGLVARTPFWDEWKGALPGNSVIPLVINLMLIALGISIAQSINPLAGWLPFVTLLLYSGGNSLVRSSGWRFFLPVDWIVLVYYSIALAYLPSRIRLILEGDRAVQAGSEKNPVVRKSILEVIVFCLLLLAGASVPLTERLISPTDLSNFTPDAEKMLAGENILLSSEIKTFLEQENAVFISGVSLYPRHVTQKSRIYLAYAPREYPFLHFWLINDGDYQIVLPLLKSPESFPHTSIVSIIGCRENNYVATWAVIQHTPEKKILLREPRSPLSCPLPEPVQN